METTVGDVLAAVEAKRYFGPLPADVESFSAQLIAISSLF